MINLQILWRNLGCGTAETSDAAPSGIGMTIANPIARKGEESLMSLVGPTEFWMQRERKRELRYSLRNRLSDPLWWTGAQRLIAACVLLALSPILIVLYPVVRLTSPGPFFYRQQRPGKGGRPFIALKIRTMRAGADKDKRLARSVRGTSSLVTPVGRFLRDIKLDEVPQLWNVIVGDMALVGPRPLASVLQSELEREIPGFGLRLRVRPGLTSLAQVAVLESSSDENVIEDWRQRFIAERHYLLNRSPLYDLTVLVLTIAFVLRKTLRKLKRFGRLCFASLLAMVSVACTDRIEQTLSTSGNAVLRTDNVGAGGEDPNPGVVEKVLSLPPVTKGQSRDPHYRIGPSDVLLINVFGEPGLSDLTVRVDASGLIQIPIVEQVAVEGRTVAQLQSELKRAFSEQFNDPWVVVRLMEYRSRPVYLLGEFNQPGVIHLEGPTNIVQAIAVGSGFSDAAYIKGARLLRGNSIYPVDINAIMLNGRLEQNVPLEPGDTIYVPNRQDLKIFVLGAVNQAGPRPFGNGVTLLEAIANANGHKTGIARLNQVRVIRSHSPVSGEILIVNAGKILNGEYTDFPLQAGDIVYVPQRSLANWNDTVRLLAPTLESLGAMLEPVVQVEFLQSN